MSCLPALTKPLNKAKLPPAARTFVAEKVNYILNQNKQGFTLNPYSIEQYRKFKRINAVWNGNNNLLVSNKFVFTYNMKIWILKPFTAGANIFLILNGN